MSDLHGLAHRLCSAGVRPHGHLYQVWQAHERVSHLPAVRDPSRARLPILRACTSFFSALQGHSSRCLGPQLASLQGGSLTRKSAVFPRPGQARCCVTSGHAQIAQASPCFSDLGVMMVTNEERTFWNLDRIFLPSSENLNSFTLPPVAHPSP